eukprot:9079104-Pyramimonas_sp.AAC.1
MSESFGEGPEGLIQGRTRTTRPRERSPNYSHHLKSGPARALSESRESTDLVKGADLGGEFLLLFLFYLSLGTCRMPPAPDFMGEPDQFSISCRVRTTGHVGEDRWVVDAVVHGIV